MLILRAALKAVRKRPLQRGMNMETLKKIANGYNKAENYLISILLILATLCCCYEVVMRYVFLSPTKWTEEVIRYMVEWLVFFGISSASKEPRDLINFDLFYNKMSDRAKKIMDLVIYGVILVLLAVILRSSVKWIFNIKKLGGVSTALSFPNWIPRTIIPISFLLLTIRFLGHFLKQLMLVIGKSEKE